MLHTILFTLITITSLGIIIAVLLQPGKSEGLSGAITGGAEQLFGKTKARGIDKILLQFTVVFSVIFFVCIFIVAFYVS